MKTLFTNFFLLLLILAPLFILAEDMYPENMDTFCYGLIEVFGNTKSKILKSQKVMQEDENKLKETREKMDQTRKMLVDLDLGVIPPDLWARSQKGKDNPPSKEEVSRNLKYILEEELSEYLKALEMCKNYLKDSKSTFDQLSKEYEKMHSDLVRLGCILPPQKKSLLEDLFNLQEKSEAPATPVSPAQIFLGTWKGTGQVLKSNHPDLLPIGQVTPINLTIATKDDKIVVTSPNNLFGSSSPYKVVISGNTITVSYTGPSGQSLPNIEVTLNFTLMATINGDKLIGKYQSSTQSVVTVMEQTTETIFSNELAINLSRETPQNK